MRHLYSEGSFFWVINNTFFQYYSLIIFIVCVAVLIGVSYMTEEPAYDKIKGLTFETMTAEHRKESRASWNISDVVTSALVIAFILVAYLYFQG